MKSEKSKSTVKSSKSRSDTAVQGTNDLSTLSKCSMVKLGYFPDNFLHHFVAKQCRRSPLIHRGYHIRTYVIDYLLKEFLKRTSPERKMRQIISLGAGFDSAFFRLKSLGLTENCIFYEVDFPQVVKRKAKIIQQVPELKALIGDKSYANSVHCAELFQDDYRLLGVDLTQVKVLNDVFCQAGIDSSSPTLILSECVLTYLMPQHSDAVIHWAMKTFTKAVFIDYEQINPSTAFGIFMQKHFAKTGSPLKCINTYPSIQSHKERFLKLGWSFCECSDMTDVYVNLISKEKRKELEQIELFDEFEEWHLKCCHYMILCAHKESTTPYLEFPIYSNSQNRTVSFPEEISSIIHNLQIPENQRSLLKRFGHSCILSFEKLLFIFGGFGKENGKFQRVSNIVISNLETLETVSLPVPTNLPKSHFALMYQSISLSTDGSIILYAGRQSPEKASSAVTIVELNNLDEDSSKLMSGEIAKEQSGDMSCGIDFRLGCKSYRINCQQLETKGEAPSSRWRHSSAIYKKNDVPVMFVYGGRDQHDTALDDGFVLDLQTKQWTKVTFRGEIPNALHSHTCSIWKNQYLVLAGGLLQESIPSQHIYLLDVDSFFFKRLKISGTLYPRYSHTAHIIENHLFLIGGVNHLHFSAGVAVINLLTGFSQEFNLPVKDQTDEIQMLHGHQSILLNNGQLTIIGGGGNCFSFGTHLNNAVNFINLKQLGLNKSDI